MSRQIKEDLEAITGRILFGEGTEKMTVGNTPIGDLPGPAKKQGPKGSGSEATDAKKADDAPESLQGDTVEDSKKGKKGSSKFEELYKQVVNEEIDGTVESGGFNDEIGDFPPAGPDEEAAEVDDGLGDEEETVGSLFAQAAEIFTKLGDLLGEDVIDDGDLIDDEGVVGDDEIVAGEAVESTPAPDSTGTLTSKGNMNVKGVKVVKKAVSSASSGEENGGKTVNCPDTNLGPKTKLKANGSGAAVDGGNKSAFE